jgi:hypothetical protein
VNTEEKALSRRRGKQGGKNIIGANVVAVGGTGRSSTYHPAKKRGGRMERD